MGRKPLQTRGNEFSPPRGAKAPPEGSHLTRRRRAGPCRATRPRRPPDDRQQGHGQVTGRPARRPPLQGRHRRSTSCSSATSRSKRAQLPTRLAATPQRMGAPTCYAHACRLRSSAGRIAVELRDGQTLADRARRRLHDPRRGTTPTCSATSPLSWCPVRRGRVGRQPVQPAGSRRGGLTGRSREDQTARRRKPGGHRPGAAAASSHPPSRGRRTSAAARARRDSRPTRAAPDFRPRGSQAALRLHRLARVLAEPRGESVSPCTVTAWITAASIRCSSLPLQMVRSQLLSLG